MKEWLSRYFVIFVVSISTLLTVSPNAGMVEGEQMKLPPARKIPGLTDEDKFPNGCTDCHINMPDRKQDERISTLMSKWNKKVDSKLLKKAQAAASAAVTLKGTHPMAPASLKNIPPLAPRVIARHPGPGRPSLPCSTPSTSREEMRTIS